MKQTLAHPVGFLILTACRITAWLSVALVVVVVFLLLKSGLNVLDWQFFTANWEHNSISNGGIAQAIVGSLWLGIGVLLLTIPFGVCTAIYLTEYSTKTSLFSRFIELSFRNLAGIPSIVFGLFGLAFFVQLFQFGSSLLAAACTLAVMTLPWVITSSIEALKAVPQQLRDSSLALGATRLQTILRVVFPMSIPGCITGTIIGVARAMGETAPIIVVGATFYLAGFPESIFDRFMALPYLSFILATQHADPNAMEYAAGVSLVLISLVLALNSFAFILRSYAKRKFFLR